MPELLQLLERQQQSIGAYSKAYAASEEHKDDFVF